MQRQLQSSLGLGRVDESRGGLESIACQATILRDSPPTDPSGLDFVSCCVGSGGGVGPAAVYQRSTARWVPHRPTQSLAVLRSRLEGGDGGLDGREEVRHADPIGQAGICEDLALPSFQPCKAERHPDLLEIGLKLLDGIDGSGVENIQASAFMTTHSTPGDDPTSSSTRWRRYSALTKNGGASKR